MRYSIKGRISSSPALYDMDGDGIQEIVIGGPRLVVLKMTGRCMSGWPRKGGKPFASSPAIGDIDGDGHPEIVAGCDDGKVYAWRSDGRMLKGWPVKTGLDVFSTPAIADVDADGHPEIVVGSDDGSLYILRGDGTILDGFPVSTGAFISSSPAVGDIDGDGRQEIVVGSWDHMVHAWKSDGSRLAGWPARTGQPVWSSPTLADIDGDGKLEVILASDRLYIFSALGTIMASGYTGGGYAVASPAVGGRDGDPIIAIAAGAVVASEKRDGWIESLSQLEEAGRSSSPAPLGNYVWASPIIADIDGDGQEELLVASWDGNIHVLGTGGVEKRDAGMETSGPLFSTPSVGDIDGDGRVEVAVGSWDGWIYLWRAGDVSIDATWPAFRGGPARTGLLQREFRGGNDLSLFDIQMHVIAPRITDASLFPPTPKHRQPCFLSLLGENLDCAVAATMRYRIAGEGREHPVPMVLSCGKLVGIIQPLGALRRVSFHVDYGAPDGSTVKVPRNGEWSFTVSPPFLYPVVKKAPLSVSINEI